MLKIVDDADNVVPIAEPNKTLIGVLEKILADAKEGKCEGALLITQDVGKVVTLQRVGDLSPAFVFSVFDEFRFGYQLDRQIARRANEP